MFQIENTLLLIIDVQSRLAPRMHEQAQLIPRIQRLIQMADILGKARRIFVAAGSDLGNVVRVLQFHSNLADFHDTYTEWRSAVGDAGLPFSALEVADDLFVPGASVIVDLWGSL